MCLHWLTHISTLFYGKRKPAKATAAWIFRFLSTAERRLSTRTQWNTRSLIQGHGYTLHRPTHDFSITFSRVLPALYSASFTNVPGARVFTDRRHAPSEKGNLVVVVFVTSIIKLNRFYLRILVKAYNRFALFGQLWHDSIHLFIYNCLKKDTRDSYTKPKG